MRPPAVTRMAAIPSTQRPRERLLELGAEALADAELVAVLLGTGTAGASALGLAHELLADLGGPYGLARADPVQLARHPGVGSAKAARITAAFALARRLGPLPRGAQLDSTADIAALVRPWLAEATRERVVLVVCNHALRVRRVCVVTEGSSDECLIPVREVLTGVLTHDGAAFAVAHNHPSGDVTPSGADRTATGALLRGAAAVGLDMLAHVVVSADRWATCDPTHP
jgi:DNA repair protein RadC